jgi:hypothetical protein
MTNDKLTGKLARWALILQEYEFKIFIDLVLHIKILMIKAIKPSGVLELQGADRRIIQDHFKNCVPYHLPNLDPTIITLT